MRAELQERYMNILREQVKEGLDILEKMSVKHKNYQQVVVNINNANNISFQLEMEMENQKKSEMAKAEADATKIVEDAKKLETAAKRKYTKKIK